MRLSRSHDQRSGFDRLSRVKSSYFFLFFSMKLSWYHDPGYKFSELTQVVFYVFFLN